MNPGGPAGMVRKPGTSEADVTPRNEGRWLGQLQLVHVTVAMLFRAIK